MSVLAALVRDWDVGGFVVTMAAGILDRGGILVRHGASCQRTEDDRGRNEQHVNFQKMSHRLIVRCARGRKVTPHL